MLHSKTRFILFLTALLTSSVTHADDSAGDLFTRRIVPILNSPNASSCSECHLSGVDLKNYIGETQRDTFASLKSAGLIDVDQPDQSKLLQFIKRAPKKPSPVGSKAREQEYAAFREWINAAVKNPDLLKARPSDDQLGPTLPLEVVRHTRKGRILHSFVENIWSEMGRCINCHSPERNRRAIGKNGRTKEDVDAISWIVPRNPAETLQKLVESGNIDLESPDDSQVLTKPLGLVEHGGGPKFPLGSRSDKNFRRFLNDYAAIVNGDYTDAKQLPEESATIAVMSGQHLRIVDLPAGLNGKLLRADLHRITGDRISESPWAVGEGPIAKKKNLWQSMIFATAPRDSPRAEQLKEKEPIPGGAYVIKIYIDRHDKTHHNRDYELGDEEFFAQVSIRGSWKPGYKEPRIVHAPAKN